MRSRLCLQFLTLVMAVIGFDVCAAPTRSNPNQADLGTGPETPQGTGQEIDEANLMVRAAAPAPEEARKTSYFPYRQSLAPRLGFAYSTDDTHPWTYALGVVYTWPRYASPQAELGADVVSKFGGHLNFAVRHTFFERNYFRPFLTWGVTHEVVAAEQLATFTNFKNYYVRGTAGFEHVIGLPRSVRIELEALAGTKRLMGLFWLGFAWAW